MTASSYTLYQINPDALSAEEIVAAVGGLKRLSQDEKDQLEKDKADLRELLRRVKRDQVQLMQIVTPELGRKDFQRLALGTIYYETELLASLLSFYSSPRLARRSPEFEKFPLKFAEAEARLDIVNASWKRVIVHIQN